MWRNLKLLQIWINFRFLHICHVFNLKFLHMTNSSPHISFVIFVTNMRYGQFASHWLDGPFWPTGCFFYDCFHNVESTWNDQQIRLGQYGLSSTLIKTTCFPLAGERIIRASKFDKCLWFGELIEAKKISTLPSHDEAYHLLPTGWMLSVSNFTLAFPV